jgi:MSHA biogenesis protein MshN
LLAGVLIKQGRWIETADLMQQGVQVVPANAVFIKLYARTLMQLNRDPQAIKLLRDHAPPLAQDPDYYALLAALYQRQQDHLAAANTYSQILKLRPDTGIWWVGLGISLEALGKQQQAQQAYARARQTGTLRGDLARYTDNRLLALDAINYPID